MLYLLDAQDLTVPTIARRLGLARQSVQRVADELVGEQLLRAVPNPDHARSALHALTEAGTDVLARINAKAAAWHRQVMRVLTPDDLARSHKLLETITEIARSARVTAVPRAD